MNKTYRLVWNDITRTWVAVAEIARTRGKRASGTLVLAAAGLIAVSAVSPAPTWAQTPPVATQLPTTQLPTGGQVVAGQAGIAQSGAAMTIIQGSNRAVINWGSFNVGSAASVNFIQPSSSAAVLNRVLDPNPSQIFGRISGNGQVFLTNPSGIYFSTTANVNVGALTATTHSIGDADFMAGKLNFSRNGATGSVVNDGNLTADLGGYIALLAPEVRNSGVIIAQMGTVALAAGEAYSLQFNGNTLADIQVSPATIAALVENGHAVQAPGGQIILSAQAANRLQGGVVKNSGALEATGLVSDGGTIRLLASDRVEHTGLIKVDAAPGKVGAGGTVLLIADLANPGSRAEINGSISARGGDLGGDGGFVETSGSNVKIGDATRVTTGAPQGNTGTWLIDPTDFTITSGSAGQTTSGIGASTLQTALSGSTDVSIATAGTGTEQGNINVNAPLTWSANKLTLSAHNDINVNATMDVVSAANLDMVAGTANVSGQGNINVNANVNVYNNDTVTPNKLTLTAHNDINVNAVIGVGNANLDLLAGSNKVNMGMVASATNPSFTGRVEWDGGGALRMNVAGVARTFTVINLDANAVQNINNNLGGYYALGSNVNLGSISNFTPIGNSTTKFTGQFDGLGHTLSGLTINASGDSLYGLFGETSGATLRNLGLASPSITADNTSLGSAPYAGTLAGKAANSTAIRNVYASSVTVNLLTNGNGNRGGLVGWGTGGSTLTNAYVSGTIAGGSIGSTISGGAAAFFTGTLSNVHSNVTVTGRKVGGLVGSILVNGAIESSSAAGTLTANVSGGAVGGLVGEANALAISNSSSTVTSLSGYNNVGGLVGQSFSGSDLTISDSTSTTSAISGVSNVGGLVGGAGRANITNSSSAATSVTGTGSYVGGLVGGGSGGGDITITGSTSNATTVESTGAGNYVGGLVGGSAGAVTITGSESKATIVKTTTTGQYVGGLLGGTSGAVIMHVNDQPTNTMPLTAAISGSGYVGGMVGQMGTGKLSGVFNGTINWTTTLATYINGVRNSGDYFGGLVGASGGDIVNSRSAATVTGSSLRESLGGSRYVGGLAGAAVNITNSYATGTVTGGEYVGGLVGRIIDNNSSANGVTNSYATGNVTGYSYVGGLVGASCYPTSCGGLATISGSYATGTVTSNGTWVGGLVGVSNSIDTSWASGDVSVSRSGGTNSVGGLAGQGEYVTNSYATGNVFVNGGAWVGGLVGQGVHATNSYATGNLSGSFSLAGGLLGLGTAENSYATGNVTSGTSVGTNPGTELGGLIGRAGSNVGIVRNNYSTGVVSGAPGTDKIGGLIGLIDSTPPTISANYWNTTTSGQTVGVGGSGASQTGATGLTTAQMKAQASYTPAGSSAGQWDFSNAGAWTIFEGSTTPLLRSHLLSPTLTAPLTLTTSYDGTNALTSLGANLENATVPAGVVAGLNIASSATAGTQTATMSFRPSAQGKILLTNMPSATGIQSTVAATRISNADEVTVLSTPTQTITGTGSAANSLAINSPISWTTGRLTLSAVNDINVNATLAGSGSASLDALAGSNKVNMAMASDGSFTGKVNFSGTGLLRMNVGGGPLAFAVINDAATLQALSSGNLAGNYALGSDFSLSGITNFTPIGNSSTAFTGRLDGLGHSLNALTQSGTTDVGLFGRLGGAVSNVRLTNASINGQSSVGALAGSTQSSGNWSVENVSAGGSVSATGSSAGGLIGQALDFTGPDSYRVVNAYFSGSVQAGTDYAGGLIGYAVTTGIKNSHSAGSVSAVNIEAGGLVGNMQGGSSTRAILSSYSTSTVTGKDYVGGLVGFNSGYIADSYASGAVSATYLDTTLSADAVAGTRTYSLGGLVGVNNGTVSNSYATGNVTVGYSGASFTILSNNSNTLTFNVGGLVGNNAAANSGQSLLAGVIQNSYATGTIYSDLLGTGNTSGGSHQVPVINRAAGLAGANETGASITGSYAMAANVRAFTDDVLQGSTFSAIQVSGLVASNQGTLTNSYYAIDSAGKVIGEGGLYTAQFSQWQPNKTALAIGNYSSTLTDLGSNVWGVSTLQGMKDLMPFAGNSAYTFKLLNSISLNSGYYIPRLAADFNGDGKTLSGVSLNANLDSFGLFGTVASTGSITNLIASGSVSGHGRVGGMVGMNDGGTISGSSFSGTVTGNSTFTSDNYVTRLGGTTVVGGLIGLNYQGTVSGSSFTGDVTGAGGAVGGLVGANVGTSPSHATITNSSASITTFVKTLGNGPAANGYVGGLAGVAYYGDISGSSVSGAGSVTGPYAGGLAGWVAASAITTSSAAVSIACTTNCAALGGLVGSADTSSITDSHATGNVTATNVMAGGLVGDLIASSVARSYATGNVDDGGTNSVAVGGLVGRAPGASTIDQSYAAGNVTALQSTQNTAGVGGLLGTSSFGSNAITNSYATGPVSGNVQRVGGLVGSIRETSNGITISNSYATGAVTGGGPDLHGGLIGASTTSNIATVTNSYWNTDTTPVQSVGIGGVGASQTGTTGLTTAQMKAQASFTPAGTGAGQWDFTNTWFIYEGSTNPLLRNFLTPLTVTADNLTKTYNGVVSTATGLSYSTTPNSNLLGTLNWNGAKDVGTYAASGLYSNQQGYLISYVNGTLTINQAPLTVTANNASKIFDSNAYTGGNGVIYSGLVNGETSSVLGGTLAYSGSSQGAINAGSYVITPGGLTSTNYLLSFVDGALTINPANLTVINGSLTGTVSKTYDGTNTATLAPSNYQLAGWAGGDGATVTKTTGTFDTTGAGTGKTVTVNLTSSDYAAQGGTILTNYALPTIISGNVGTISRANATVTGNSATGTYSGVAQSVSGFTATGLVNGETAGVLTSPSATGATLTNAGSTDNTVSGNATDGNYNLTFVNGALTINKANATVTANSGTTTYSGVAQSVTGFTASGLVNGETTSVLSGVTTTGGSGTNAASYTHTASGTAGNYNLSFVNGALTVNQAPLTVTANNASKTYDGIAYTGGNGVGYSGFVNSETSSVLGGTLTYGGTSQGAINAGNYVITPGGLTSTNYLFSFVNGALTVNRANATVTANSATTTYSGLAQSVSGFTATGLVNSEPTSVLNGVTSGATGTNAGSYVSTAAVGTYSGNYNLTFVNGALAISRANATITGNSATGTYSGLAQSVSGFTATGLVNSETASVLSSPSATGATSTNAGSYTNTVSGTATDGNYNLTFVNGALTVNRANAIITGNSATGTYSGLAQSVSGFTATGLVNSETASVLSSPSATGATGTNAGSYTNTVSGTATDGNYNLTFVNGALAINRANATITGNSATGTYSGAAQSVSGFTATGLVNNETASVLSSPSATGATGTNAGSYTNTVSGTATDGNYNLSFVNGALAINQRPITVTANGQSKTYGDADPTLTYTVNSGSLVNGDSLGTLTRAAGANVGDYVINGSSLANGNYLITANNGTLTINQRPITVTADAQSKTYGDADPTLTYTVNSGSLVNGDSLGTLTRAAGGNVGGYTINGSSLANGNYLITANNGTLTIVRANATVIGNSSAVIFSGQEQSVTGFTVNGLKNGETAIVLTSPTASGAVGTNAGSYINTVTGDAIDGNYNLTFVNGVLTITSEIAPPPPPPAPPPSLPPLDASAGTTPLATTGTASSGTAGSTSDTGTSATSGSGTTTTQPVTTTGIVISPTVGANGAVAVTVPSSLLGGFTLVVPVTLVSVSEGGTSTAMTASGTQLPSWLSFDPITLALKATSVPAGELPLTILVTVDGTQVRLEIKSE